MALSAEGKTLRQIVEALGVGKYYTLRVYIRNHGIPWQNEKRGLRSDSGCARHHEEVKRLAEEGATLEVIARLAGTNIASVVRYLTHHNIQRPEWRRRPGTSPMSRPTRGELNPAWRGGRIVEKRGYIRLWTPEGYVWEHRHVMEQKLGRPLLQTEVVDHIDGDTGNNHPDNLRVFPSNAEHLRATLTGVPCPARGNRYDANGQLTRTGGQPSPDTTDHSPA